MEEEILTLSSLERRSWADFISPSYVRIGGKPPPWSKKQISQGGSSLGGSTSPPGAGKRQEPTLSGEFLPRGEWSVRRPPPTQVE